MRLIFWPIYLKSDIYLSAFSGHSCEYCIGISMFEFGFLGLEGASRPRDSVRGVLLD